MFLFSLHSSVSSCFLNVFGKNNISILCGHRKGEGLVMSLQVVSGMIMETITNPKTAFVCFRLFVWFDQKNALRSKLKSLSHHVEL